MTHQSLALAEILQARGFVTAGFVSTNVHFVAGNLDQGFDLLDEPPREPVTAYRPAEQTIAQAIEWVEQRRRGESWLLWIHLFDPHDPYRPPGEHLDPFSSAPAAERKELAAFFEDVHRTDVTYLARLEALVPPGSQQELPQVDEETLERLRSLGYVQ